MCPSPADFNFDDPEFIEHFREELADLSARARMLPREIRHDIGNAIGAARNALELIAEYSQSPERQRFIEIARRNAERAEHLLASAGDPGNQGNDLRSASKGDHGNALGF